MMKIRSQVDVITNSSTEVFILRDFRSEDEVKNLLDEYGFQGDIFKFTRNLWEKHLKSVEKNYHFEELSSVFCDSSSKDIGWTRLYVEYLTSPKEETPECYEDLEYYNDAEIKDIHKKFINEVFVPLVEKEYERLKRENGSSYRAATLDRFLKDPIKDYTYICPTFLLWREQDTVIDFIEKNKDQFPEYPTLLRMYNMHDISELFDTWIDFFDDDSISPDKFLGGVYDNEKFDYELYRLS